MIARDRFLGEFTGVDGAWRAMVRAVASDGNDVPGSIDPLSIGSSFGDHPRGFRELIGVSLVLRNPRNRLVRSEVRRIHWSYILANVIWSATGSDEVTRIAFYNPRGREFSDDHTTLAAAIGKRIFRSSQGDQFAACAELLCRDPTTRRAVVSIFTPDDVGSLHRDCSCVLTMQFLQRSGELHCIVTMRSQSAVMLFPYDAFVLTMLHESMAVQIGARLGYLAIQYGSLHYYHDEADLAAGVMQEVPRSSSIFPPMRMPLTAVTEYLSNAEAEIRDTGNFASHSELDAYWMTYLTALKHAVEGGATASMPDCLAFAPYPTTTP